MAISNFSDTNHIIEISEFVDFVDSYIDISDDESVISASTMLQALANNKKTLIDTFNRDLLNYDIDAGVSYSQSSSILAVGQKKNFAIRANMWPATNLKNTSIESSLFSYELPHNHNFSFLTANYFGPGYETDIWECLNPNEICGEIGEEIAIQFLEHTRLQPGKQIFFRRQKDIHVQYPPEEFSMSLNLLVMTEQDNVRDQFEFDIENKKISNFPNGTSCSKRVFFMKMAGKLGNENTANILLKLAEKHPCQRTRAEALASAFDIIPSLSNTLPSHIKDDKSPFVQAILNMRA